MSIDQIQATLKEPERISDFAALLSEIRQHKVAAVAASDEAGAKFLWCLEHTAEAQSQYLTAFQQIQSGRFFDAWCSLEQVELSLSRVQRHIGKNWPEFRLDFISDKITAIQSLYPYKIFMSPEIIEHEKQCNICGQTVAIRKPCGHVVGEIYGGVDCCRIVTKCDFVSTSFVKSPLQKYSVPFLVDPKTGQSYDHYDYSTVKYLAQRWPSPYHLWHSEWTTALHPKEHFGQLRRNDKCPCDSGKKYKNCCMRKEGIQRPHVQFTFHYPIPQELQTVEFSGRH